MKIPKPQPEQTFAIGERVSHIAFGPGSVIDTDGDKTEVDFDNGRTKRIVASFLQAAANDDAPEIALPAMHPAPFAPEAAGGLLAKVSTWITATAIVPSPELSLVAAMALLAGVFGKHALGQTNSGINLYLTTTLATAGG